MGEKIAFADYVNTESNSARSFFRFFEKLGSLAVKRFIFFTFITNLKNNLANLRYKLM